MVQYRDGKNICIRLRELAPEAGGRQDLGSANWGTFCMPSDCEMGKLFAKQQPCAKRHATSCPSLIPALFAKELEKRRRRKSRAAGGLNK